METKNTIMTESEKLYAESSKLRTMAKMFKANGDIERPGITFNAVELDGFSSLLMAAADNIDDVRDKLPHLTR
jgi:hypothetical protein